MSDCEDTARLSSDERLLEIASILAAAIVRLHERTALPATTNLIELPSQGLEVPAETVLSVHVG